MSDRESGHWGIGLTGWVSGHAHFLNDGRARSLMEAILWHGGEAEAARDPVVALPAADRDALIRFKESLCGAGSAILLERCEGEGADGRCAAARRDGARRKDGLDKLAICGSSGGGFGRPDRGPPCRPAVLRAGGACGAERARPGGSTEGSTDEAHR